MLRLAFLSLWRRPLRYGMLVLLTAVACALPVFVIQMAGGLYQGLNRAAAPFPILAGAKGSPYQLVLNTVFLRDRPIGNIPYGEVDDLRQSGKADRVLPLAFGDSYRGFRLCGTEPEIFSYVVPGEHKPWLRPARGRSFAGTGEAVLGAETARLTGLQVGDVFQSSHGFIGKGKAHHHPYRVVGILAPVQGPYDKAILVPLKDIWEAHAGHGAALVPGQKGEVTAILVRPKGYGQAMALLAAWQRKKGGLSQLLFPAQSLIALHGMVGQSRKFWITLSLGLLGAATLVTLLALYWDGTSRMEEWALLRALGASRRKTQALLLLEQFLLLLLGSTLGWCLGWGGSLLAAEGIGQQAAVQMSRVPLWQGFLAPALLLGAGTLGGLVPLWLLRKKDIAPYL